NKRCHQAGALRTSGKTSDCHRPLRRPWKTAVQSVESRQSHGRAPAIGIVRHKLTTVAGQDHPALRERCPTIEVDQIITIEAFEIARREYDQNRPWLMRFEVSRDSDDSHTMARYILSRVRCVELFLSAERN